MKNFIKKLMAVLAFAVCLQTAHAQNYVNGVINKSSTGTTSATVFIEPGDTPVEITDMRTRLDAGVTTGFVSFSIGDVAYPVTSATSSSGTVVFFTNTGTAVAAQEFVIVYDSSAGDYFLRKVTAAATTSVTVAASISPALTVDDTLWSIDSVVERPVLDTTSRTDPFGQVWLPKGKPVAVTVDGNTTACRIAISGVRGNTK